MPPLESSWYTPVTACVNCPELPASNTEGLDPQSILSAMRVTPETASDLDVLDPMDPEENIAGGARFLRHLLDRYMDDPAYNAFPTRVTDRIPAIPETKAYVSAILGRMLPMLGVSGH